MELIFDPVIQLGFFIGHSSLEKQIVLKYELGSPIISRYYIVVIFLPLLKARISWNKNIDRTSDVNHWPLADPPTVGGSKFDEEKRNKIFYPKKNIYNNLILKN